jgi:hypothetical protein
MRMYTYVIESVMIEEQANGKWNRVCRSVQQSRFDSDRYLIH